MRSASAELDTHIWEECPTLTTIWKLKRADASLALGFTEHDRDLTYDDGGGEVTYKSTEGYSVSTAAARVGGSVDSMDATAFFASPDLTDDDLQRGLWDHATVTIYLVNWADLTQGHILLFHGSIGEVSSKGVEYKAELRSLAAKLQTRQGRSYTADCDASRVGDERCQFQYTSAFYTDGTVASSTNPQVFTSSALNAADHWYAYGLLVWTAGNNAGRESSVQSQVGDVLTLMTPTPRDIEIGDTFRVYAGCDRTHHHCVTKFDNVVNFQGFQHIPGNDAVFSYGSQ